MFSVHSFTHRCQFAYSFLDLPEYQECTARDALFGYSYSFDGYRYEVQIKQSYTSGDITHLDIHHIDSSLVELSIPEESFFAELDKSIQRKLDEQEVVYHA